MYIELRMQNNNENYKQFERRTHYDNLKLEIDACPQITVTDLFKAEQLDMPIPVRTLVIGKAGIGKTMLSMHIVDQWLDGNFLAFDIHHLYLFRLRDLTGIEKCSLEDLFFKYQSGGMTSHNARNAFFKQLSEEPHKTLIIFDGLDEAGILPKETEVFARNIEVEMPRLMASIINGYTIPSTRVLVTSRPGGVPNYSRYDNKAEIYGFTRSLMSDYIQKYSVGNRRLQKSIENYLDQNVNICSFCYIPVQLNMTCRIVRERMQHGNNPQLPETLTELFVGYVTNFIVHQNVDFKDMDEYNPVDAIAKLKDYVLNHARIARYGMEQCPIKVTFSKKNIQDFQLESVTTKCGLLTESRESGIAMFTRAVQSVFYFQHLTLQEFLAALGLVTDIEEVQGMMGRASERQLDLMIMFMAGLLGNNRTHTFLDSLQVKPTASVDKLIKLVVDRERINEDSITYYTDQRAAHRTSTLLLLMIIYESQEAKLWSHVSDYVLKDSDGLDLEGQHVSPSELHALVYVLPEMGITSLK